MVPTHPRPQPLVRWRIALPLLVLGGLVVYTVLPQVANVGQTAALLHRLRWWGIALATLAQAVSYWGNGYTVRSLAWLAHDRLSIWAATGLAVAAGSIGLVAGGPLGYAAATHHWARRQHLSGEGAVLCGVLPSLLNAVVVVGIAVAGVIRYGITHHSPTGWVVVLFSVSVPFLILTGWLVWIARSETRLARLLARTQRLWDRIRHRQVRRPRAGQTRLAHALTMVVHGGWHRPLAGAIVNAAFDVLTLYFLFVAARLAPSVGVLLTGYGAPKVVARFVPIPGGLGVVEGGMAGAYIALGIGATPSVVVVLAYRVLSFWLPLIGGLIVAVDLERSARSARV